MVSGRVDDVCEERTVGRMDERRSYSRRKLEKKKEEEEGKGGHHIAVPLFILKRSGSVFNTASRLRPK